MAKPALKLEPAYRSGLEKSIAAQLEAAGLPVNFEKLKIKYVVPEKEHTYTPDFHEGSIIIEGKGAFGYGPNRFIRGNPAEQRRKLILVKQQNPGLDIRIVFQRASTKINKGSPTTYAKWAESNGFKWADKGILPPEWIEEMIQQRDNND